MCRLYRKGPDYRFDRLNRQFKTIEHDRNIFPSLPAGIGGAHETRDMRRDRRELRLTAYYAL
jgi:hypothetical protein